MRSKDQALENYIVRGWEVEKSSSLFGNAGNAVMEIGNEHRGRKSVSEGFTLTPVTTA